MQPIHEQEIIKFFKKSSIHVTQNRIVVFTILRSCKTAQSVNSILKLTTTALDKISVYRALKHFLKKGIVIAVPNNDRETRYILNIGKVDETVNDKHSYFICTCCKLTEVIVAPFNIVTKKLTQYKVNKFSLILEGLCTNCK